MAEDELVGWHHRLDGHKFEQALAVRDGQGSLVYCSPWGRNKSDTTERLNNDTNLFIPNSDQGTESTNPHKLST